MIAIKPVFRRPFSDDRVLFFTEKRKDKESLCIYCQEPANTREHVPSKIFLDEPYPDYLSVVPACMNCNNSFSMDEAYVACLVDYLKGLTFNSGLRGKIQNHFDAHPQLFQRLKNATKKNENNFEFIFEDDRIKRILLKLAVGHLAYECNEIMNDEPIHLNYAILPHLDDQSIESFNSNYAIDLFPEVGSPLFQTIIELPSGSKCYPWFIIQDNQYRFMVGCGDSYAVRLVISEYLFAEIIWR